MPSEQEMITSFDRANIFEIDLIEVCFSTVEDVASITNNNDAGVIMKALVILFVLDFIKQRIADGINSFFFTSAPLFLFVKKAKNG